jgi:hypothetical protein
MGGFRSAFALAFFVGNVSPFLLTSTPFPRLRIFSHDFLVRMHMKSHCITFVPCFLIIYGNVSNYINRSA